MRGLSEIIKANITAITCGENCTTNTNTDMIDHKHVVNK